MATVVSGSNPGSRVVSTADSTIIAQVVSNADGSNVGGGGVSTGTYTFFHVAASASLSGGIPVTAKRWAVNFIGTGTGNTIGGNTAVTGNQGFGDSASPSVAIVITCDSATVADGFYSTT